MVFILSAQWVACTIIHCAFRRDTHPAPGSVAGLGSAGPVRPADRQLIRPLAWQLLRLWWWTRFTEWWWHLRARITRRILRRRLCRLSRRRRRYLRRVDRHRVS